MKNGLKISAAGTALAVCIVLTACETTAERDLQIQSRVELRLASLIGLTMADFQSQTGVLPVDAYNGDGGRVFVVEGGTCRVLIQTHQAGSTNSADNWVINGVRRFGGCDFLGV